MVQVQNIARVTSSDRCQPLIKIFAAAVVAVVLFCASTYSLENPSLSLSETAEQWEAIAKMRFQIARDHELQAEQTYKRNGAIGFENFGDLLDFCGDEKIIASENYQKASQNWEKAAKAYQSTGDSSRAEEARENTSTALEAAKRTIREAGDLYVRAKDQHAATNNLNKEIQSVEKAAGNFERLMELK